MPSPTRSLEECVRILPDAQVLSLALLAAACAPKLPDPVVTSVVPDWAYNGESEDIQVFGENFYPVVELDVRDEGAHLDRQFAIELRGESGSYPLEAVELLSYEELQAEVPEGLPVGLYTLAVTSPTDAVTKLPRVFWITDTMAHHLALDIDEVYYTVSEAFDVRMELQDPYSEPMVQNLDIVLTITSEESPSDFEVTADGLAAAQIESVEGGYVILGTLLSSEDRENTVTITGHAEETLSLELAAYDDGSDIEPGTARVGIIPGNLSEIEINLPYEGFDTEAGEEFSVELRAVDASEVLISDLEATVVVYETCGTFSTSLDLVGSAIIDVAVTGATNEDCPENTLVAAGSAPGTSAPFEVLPAEPVRYDVEVFPGTVVAGVDPLYVSITALDEFGNTVTDYGEDWQEKTKAPLDVSLYDELGGLGDIFPNYSCPGFEQGYQICWAKPVTAGQDDTITAEGDDGLEGKSGEFNVITGDVNRFLLVQEPSPYAAGIPFTLEVQVEDEHGNSIETDPTRYVYTFTGSAGEIDCEPTVPTAEGWEFDCIATLAADEQTITVINDDLAPGISAVTDPFDVTNGVLAVVDLDTPSGPQVAGSSFNFGLQAYDDYDNPYTVQAVTPTVLDLVDTTGTLDPSSVELDTDGLAEVTAFITGALEGDVVTASDSTTGDELGVSPSFDVQHAEPSILDIEPVTPWVFLGDDLSVTVTAQDAYGNTALSFDEVVDLTTSTGSAPDVELESFQDGVATAILQFDTPIVSERLDAEASTVSISGSYEPLDALDPDCGTIEASLTVDGSNEPVMCLSSGTVTAMLDGSGSTSTGSIDGYHFADSLGNQYRTPLSIITMDWTEQAAVPVQLVVFDNHGCGDHDSVVAWVAEPDGEPAGPVTVVPQDYVRIVGSSTDGITTVDVEAFDCAGDVSAYGTLLLRTDLGVIDPSATLTRSGEGIELVLDGSGVGEFEWSVETGVHGGTSTVFVGRDASVALGTADIIVQADDDSPVVLEVDPIGTTDEITDTLRVRFSEPIRSASITIGNISVSDSSGDLEVDELAFDSDTDELSITLVQEVDLGADEYWIELADQVRDDAGNRLGGDWSGRAASFEVGLGAVSDSAPDVANCPVDTAVLRPDGDETGGGDESDQVEVQVAATSFPIYWLLEVLDASGDEVARYWSEASADSESLYWNARNQEGLVVDNDTYTLRASAADISLNLGTECEVQVTVDNRVVEVE